MKPFYSGLTNNSLVPLAQERESNTIFKPFITEALGIKRREMISLVGAGGKTTLMFLLAKELVFIGRKVITTTTTKIFEPSSEETNLIFIEKDETRMKEWVKNNLHLYPHLTVAQERLEAGKLKGVSQGLVNDLWNLNTIDVILIEADGAAGRPLKAPEEKEPVIPSETTLVIATLGIDGMGVKLNEENAFRAEQISKITGIPIGEKITEEAMSDLITHPEGIFKGAPFSSRVIAFLNKVDIPEGLIKAKQLAEKVIEKRHPQIERIVLGQLKASPKIMGVIFQS